MIPAMKADLVLASQLFREEGCAFCGDDVRIDLEDSSFIRLPSGALQNSGGVLVLPNCEGAYCGECGPDIYMCRICGCTQEYACEGDCSWIETNEKEPHKSLCSNPECIAKDKEANHA